MQLPGSANTNVALTTMHNWDSDFVSVAGKRLAVPLRTLLIHIPGCVPRVRLQT